MFYSHEILTSRKHGVATVWLVATLGAKSTVKKVSRKAIFDVDISGACAAIIQPSAPLALRLQSNLLYGISRVFSQQCAYVLSDAQNTQTNIRTMLRVQPTAALDTETGRVRRDQLMLMDDPAFIPEMGLPPPDFNIEDLLQKANQHTPSTQLSIMSKGKVSSARSSFSIDLGLPSSSTGVSSYRLPADTRFRFGDTPTIRSPILKDFHDEHLEALVDDIDFEFDAEGNIVDISQQPMQQPAKKLPGGFEPNSSAQKRVLQEHADARAFRLAQQTIPDDDLHRFSEEDILNLLQENIEYPLHPHSITAATAARRGQLHTSSSTLPQTSSPAAPTRMRKRFPKLVLIDRQTQISKAELKDWQMQYLTNMESERLIKNYRYGIRLAKSNAATWVFTDGLGGVGRGLGSNAALGSPLGMFAGDSLRAMIIAPDPKHSLKRTRRDASTLDDMAEASRRVRARDEYGTSRRGLDDQELPRLDDDADFAAALNDVERGRAAPTPLEPYPSSGMPWNIGSSIASLGLPGSSVSRSGLPNLIPSASMSGRDSSSVIQPRRLLPNLPHRRQRSVSYTTEPSPLFGRGAPLPPDLPQIERLDLGDEGGGSVTTGRGLSAPRPSSVDLDAGRDDFILPSPVTQLAGRPRQLAQWVVERLDQESLNFLEFTRHNIAGQAAVDDQDALMSDSNDSGDMDHDATRPPTITFESMIPPTQQCAVAAQAFLHVLTLATKNILCVSQPREHGPLQMWLHDGVVEADVDMEDGSNSSADVLMLG